MTEIVDRYVSAHSLSEAWFGALDCVQRQPGDERTHLVVRIAEPASEDPHLRALADELVALREQQDGGEDRYKPIDTVRNTVFPAAWARRRPEPAQLAAHYRDRYGRKRLRAFTENRLGTYFGRLVAYPRADGTCADQLTDTVEKLRGANDPDKQTWSSRYEMNVYSEERDSGATRGFPCLSFISLHLADGVLHMHATYRNEYLVARGYGNYLGLAQLQQYMAHACCAGLGELLIIAGHVKLDATKRDVRAMLARVAVN